MTKTLKNLLYDMGIIICVEGPSLEANRSENIDVQLYSRLIASLNLKFDLHQNHMSTSHSIRAHAQEV